MSAIGRTIARRSAAALAGAVLLSLAACGGTAPATEPPGPDPYLTGRAVLGWGGNDAGQLGDGTTLQRLSPVPVPGLDGVRAVASGGDRSLVLLVDGTVWQWGSGQPHAAQVPGLSGVVAIAAGERHALALTAAHQVFAWGENESGQLGDHSTTAHAAPVLVNNLSDVVAVAAGRAHSLAIRSDLTMAAWGADAHGQLGDGGTANRLAPVVVPGVKAIEVAAAVDHTVVVSSGVHVLAWGDNHACQLGENPPQKNPFDPVRCEDSPTPLDLGADVTSSGNAIAASATATLIRTPQGGVEMVGRIDDDPQRPVCTNGLEWGRGDLVGAPPVAAVVSGARHTLLITPDGRAFGIGANNAGQLGGGSVGTRSCLQEATALRGVGALAAGGTHSLAVVSGILTAAPSSPVAFPSTAVGATATATVTLTNTGRAPLAIYRVVTEGEYASGDDCPDAPTSLPAGGTCRLTLTFTPGVAGPRPGAVTVGHDGMGRSLRLELLGTGREPRVVLAPALLDFGSQRVGTTSQPARTVTIRNDGDADLVIDDLQASAGFDVTATTCPAAPQALPPAGGSCTVDVVFEPLEARTALGELSVTYNGAKTAAMTLRGTGVSPSGAITPASITFPPTQVGGASAPVSVTVRSTAALPLVLGAAAVTGDAQLGSDGCSGTTLAHQNDTCTLELRFVPTAVGPRTGTLTLPTDGLPATLTVSANGIGS